LLTSGQILPRPWQYSHFGFATGPSSPSAWREIRRAARLISAKSPMITTLLSLL
jgi:hypothetical protein